MYHQLTIAGYLGKDPEQRFTPSGKGVVSFSVATTRKYTGGDGQIVQETMWVKVNVWGKQGENCNQYLHKGSAVLVVGELKAEPYAYIKDDEPKAGYEMTARDVKFLPSGKAQGEEVPF